MLSDQWKVSSYTGVNNCVEVRKVGERIEVRNTKDRDGGTQSYTVPEWLAFLNGVKGNEFDL